MNCPTKQALLDVVNGLAKGEALEPHLRTCETCRKSFEGLKVATEVFSRTPYRETSGHCLSDEQLTRYATRSIHPDMEQEVEEHLSSCPKCMDEVVSLSEALEAAPEEAPADLRSKILALGPRSSSSSATHRAVTGRTSRMSGRIQPARSPAFAWALAAAILVAVLLVIVAMPKGGDETKPDTVKKEEIRKDDTAREEPKKEEPKKDEHVKKEEPKKETPKKDDELVIPKKEDLPEPKKDEELVIPKKDEPRKEEPKKDEPKKDETVVKETKYVSVPVSSVRGELYVKRNGARERVSGLTEVSRSDILETGHRWKAAFNVGDDCTVSVREGTQLQIEKKDDGSVRISLADGEAYFDVSERKAPFVVWTPNADAIVKGTSFDIIVKDVETTLMVIEGAVKFKNTKGEVEVTANKYSVAKAGSRPMQPVARTELAATVAWTKKGDIATTPTKDPYIENIPGSNARFRSLVISAPYAQWEFDSARLARATSDFMDAGLVLGHNHRDKKDKKIWINIDRGTEGKVADNGDLGQAETTKRAQGVYEEYMRNVRAAAKIDKGPVPFIVTLRNHSETVPGGKDELAVCEVAWNGFQKKAIVELKALYDKLLEKYKPRYRVVMKFDELDDRYDFLDQRINFKFTESDAKNQGYMQSMNSKKAITFFFNPSFGKNAEDFEVYARILAEMIEFLYSK